jgi:hypothetical protein
MRHSLARVIFLLSVTLFSVAPRSNAQTVNHTCTNASIAGTYGYSVSGLLVSNGFAPFVAAGTLTSDGNGNLTAKDSATTGTVVARTLTGTYTVNTDCTGSVALTDNLANSAQYNVIIAGDSIQFMETDTGTIIAGEAKRRRTVCTVQDINGSYDFAVTGWYFPNGSLAPTADTGKLSANGAGTLSLTDALSQAGTVTSRTISGTYAVNADCTGLATFNDPTLGPSHANFTVVAPGGEIQFIQTDPGVVVSGSASHQFRAAGALSHVASGGIWKTTGNAEAPRRASGRP